MTKHHAHAPAHADDGFDSPAAPAAAEPSLRELMAVIKAQGEQIASLQAKLVAPAAAEARPRAPALPPELVDAPPWTIKVRAIRKGFYPNRMPDGTRGQRHIVRHGAVDGYTGDEFVIEKAGDFAPMPHGWMELASVKPAEPEQLPSTTIPNRVQDPMGAPAGNPQRYIES